MRSDRCSPLLRAYVPSMLRKQPTMSIEVLDTVLPFSVNGLVKIFPDRPALSFCFRVMSFDVWHHHRERLRSISHSCRTFGAFARASQHDICAAEVHLDAAYRLAISVVLREPEYPYEPFAGMSHIAVDNMREQGTGWYGAIIHSDSIHEFAFKFKAATTDGPLPCARVEHG